MTRAASSTSLAPGRRGTCSTRTPPTDYRYGSECRRVDVHVGAASYHETWAGPLWTADRRMHNGELYGYVVDGEGPFPDPRSMFQPLGVHALSEAIDHTRFEWTDDAWQPPPLAAGVIYELHIGTFSDAGTFEGAICRLPHLVDLGVTHVERCPSPSLGERGWGSDGVDLFAPHHTYGRPDISSDCSTLVTRMASPSSWMWSITTSALRKLSG